MEKLHGSSNVQGGRGHCPLLPTGPSEAVYGGSIHLDKQADMPSSSSTNVPIEPSWLEDLLNEPETPVNRRHRRSASDSLTCLGENSKGKELWLGNSMGRPAWGFQTPQYFNGQASLTRKLSSISEELDNLCKSSSTTPLTNSIKSAKEDAGCKGLGFPCPQSESDRVIVVGSEMQNQASGISNTSDDSFGGSNGSQAKPSVPQAAPKSDVKQKQYELAPPPYHITLESQFYLKAFLLNLQQHRHNARRSRARKLQYIAELERNVQALQQNCASSQILDIGCIPLVQVEGAAVSAQLEFLDQQNLLLVMENRALKQRLESLSQEHLIKLQYLYHLQNLSPPQHQRHRQKQKAAVHRRGRSCDLDSQFSRLSLYPSESASSKGSP
ncbi:hypothetical protein Cgig2_029564 [Carnegiea gigantea]|uniref:Uncharacterized protein n=1 Tax=Carnegiea gigantea TaxID=171969 RepID=A0A9Q1KL14_9CARY|nr:hypothetical protein Cgig2_029564 [Carnegiea gigantea]